MLVLCVQEWAALGPQSMPTNNLSLTLGPGREEEEEEETVSARTKCPAQGRERKRWAMEGTQRWRGEEREGEIRTQRETLSARDHLDASHSHFFLVNNHQKWNSSGSTSHIILLNSIYCMFVNAVSSKNKRICNRISQFFPVIDFCKSDTIQSMPSPNSVH